MFLNHLYLFMRMLYPNASFITDFVVLLAPIQVHRYRSFRWCAAGAPQFANLPTETSVFIYVGGRCSLRHIHLSAPPCPASHPCPSGRFAFVSLFGRQLNAKDTGIFLAQFLYVFNFSGN